MIALTFAIFWGYGQLTVLFSWTAGKKQVCPTVPPPSNYRSTRASFVCRNVPQHPRIKPKNRLQIAYIYARIAGGIRFYAYLFTHSGRRTGLATPLSSASVAQGGNPAFLISGGKTSTAFGDQPRFKANFSMLSIPGNFAIPRVTTDFASSILPTAARLLAV